MPHTARQPRTRGRKNVRRNNTRPSVTTTGPHLHTNYMPRVIVKLRDNGDTKKPWYDANENIEALIERYKNIELSPQRYLGQFWNDLKDAYPNITIQRRISAVPPKKILQIVDQARKRNAKYCPPNFMNQLAVRCPTQKVANAVANALRSWENVEETYVESVPKPKAPPPRVVPPGPNALTDWYQKQGYLGPAPGGINAQFAWRLRGGDGGGDAVGLQFADIEQGWVFEHEDLVAAGVRMYQTRDYYSLHGKWRGHGTCVLGIVLAAPNDIGCVGITPNVAKKWAVSEWSLEECTDDMGNVEYCPKKQTANAIWAAIDQLEAGDVLLLEAQTDDQLPIEVEDAAFDAILAGSNKGIVIVEAAGNGNNRNGGFDLDAYEHPNWGRILDRSLPGEFRDSGAIMVAAGASALINNATHDRSRTNYGSRIDCYAWGEDITTTGIGAKVYSTNGYTNGFDGTSGAAAIIAGAALAVQGIYAAANNTRLPGVDFDNPNALQLREILSDSATGTPSTNPATDKIGVMPDLDRIITQTLGIVRP